MKKQIALLLLLCLLLAGCAVSPAGESSTAATVATAPSTIATEPSTVPTDAATVPTETTTAPTEPTTEPTTAPTEPTFDEEEIRSIADPAIIEHHHLPNLDDYYVRVSSGPKGYRVEYELIIGKYRTWESYTVSLDTDLQIENIYGDYGQYAQYLPYVTPEMIEAAEASLEQQSAAYTENGPVYMSIDEEGYLVLRKEIIHEYDPIVPDSGGCGIDHDHIFFTARICPKP